MSNIVPAGQNLPAVLGEYNGVTIGYDPSGDGMVNATAMCKAAGKLWADYWRTQQTQAFADELSRSMGIPIDLLVVTVSTGVNARRGTWVHPDVAIDLAKWCSPAFQVWATQRIRQYLITGRLPALHPEHQEAQLATRDPALLEILGAVKEGQRQQAQMLTAVQEDFRFGYAILESMKRRSPKQIERAVVTDLMRSEPGMREPKIKGLSGTPDLVTRMEVIEVKHHKDWRHAIGQVRDYYDHVVAAFGPRRKRIHLFCEPGEDTPPPDKVREIEERCFHEGIRLTWHEWSNFVAPSVQKMLPLFGE